VIVTLGAAVMLMLALGAWSSWSRLAAAKRSSPLPTSRPICSRRWTASVTTAP
jgi:hypothetical protein